MKWQLPAVMFSVKMVANVSAGSQNVRCSCPLGYRGSRCESRVSSCQYFGNWTKYFNGFYYTVNSYEGSLSSWFCAQGLRPEFAYSVCQKPYYSPSWSHTARCQSLTTTTRRTIPYIPRTEAYKPPTDLFKHVNAWLIPVVIVTVILVQILAPFIIYCSLILCCGYQKKTSKLHAKADKKEDKDIAEKYKNQLEELTSQTLNPDNTITTSELHRIEQELTAEIDHIRARRRQRNREKKKSAKLFRITLLHYYVSFWLWMIYLIIGYAAKLGQYASVLGILVTIAIICVIVLPIVILIESWFSAERQYIKNLSSLTSSTDRIESIRNTQPTVMMNAVCYHFELRTRTVYYTDANGNSQSRTETYQEKVITAVIVEPYLFTHWFDSSESTLTDIRKVGITKIKMDLTIQFGDQITEQHFSKKFQRFQSENRYRDVYVDFSVTHTVDGFEKRLAAYTDASNKPEWISSLWFWLATLLCLGWPYRIMFNRSTGRTEYSVVTVIFTNAQSMQSTSSDDDHSPENANETSNADDISDNPSQTVREGSIKSNIEAMLDRLTAGLSKNDDQTPIKTTATDQHMNVTLKEAHHAAQTAVLRNA